MLYDSRKNVCGGEWFSKQLLEFISEVKVVWWRGISSSRFKNKALKAIIGKKVFGLSYQSETSLPDKIPDIGLNIRGSSVDKISIEP